MKATTAKIAGWRKFAGISAVLLASTALTAPSAQAGEAVLSASDFTYEGMIKISGPELGGRTDGLAYRKSTNSWFTIARYGRNPYELIEISLPAPHLGGKEVRATIVKNWGPLNVNGALDVRGSLVAMKGLFWDDKENKLWFTFGSYYANAADNNVIGYATLDTGKPVIHGPWKVSLHSDLAKGMILEAPTELQAITHQRFLMFGIRGSTAQGQSWGTGLISVAEPTASNAPGTALTSEKLIHWPLILTHLAKPYGVVASSGFHELPTDMSTLIKGNDNVGVIEVGAAQRGTANTITLSSTANFNPSKGKFRQTLVGWYVTNLATGEQLEISGWDDTTKIATVASRWKKSIPVSGTRYELYRPSYQPNFVQPPSYAYSEASFIDHAVWIDLPTKHGLVYFGGTPVGYQWYGNPDAHTDSTPNGATYNNNFQSLLNPGQALRSDSQARGDHAEKHVLRWYIVNPDAVLNVAGKAMAGTATAQDMQIPWTSAGDVRTLGGNVQLSSNGRSFFGQSYWDAKDGLLYTLAACKANSGCVEVWKVQ